MSKIINIQSIPDEYRSPYEPTYNLSEPLRALQLFYKSASEFISIYAPLVDQVLKEAVTLIGQNIKDFMLDTESVGYFDTMLKAGAIGNLRYIAYIEDAEYLIVIMPPKNNDLECPMRYYMRKYEAGIPYIYKCKTRSWEFIDDADILDEIAKAYNGELTEKKYRKIKLKNQGLFHLYEQVSDFMAPYYHLDENGKNGKLYLVPDNNSQLGFRVGWNGSEYILYQFLDPLDLVQMEDDFLEVGDIIPDDYIREVSRTSNVKKMSSCLLALTNRPIKDITATVPLSLEVFTETANLYNFGHKLRFINCPKRKLTNAEQKTLDSAKEYVLNVK